MPRPTWHQPPRHPSTLLALAIMALLSAGPALAAPTDYRAILDQQNDRLKWAGVDPVLLDPEWSLRATLHAEYLAHNAGSQELSGLRAHVEHPGRPGYSELGASSIGSGGIAWSPDLGKGLDQLLATPVYHRALVSGMMGVAAARTATVVWFFADPFGDLAPQGSDWQEETFHRFGFVRYPGPGQTIATGSGLQEVPDPFPPEESGKWFGYPITLRSLLGKNLRVVTVDLQDTTGQIWPCFAMTRENEVTIVPRDELTGGRTYRITVDLLEDNCRPSRHQWSFAVAAAR